MSDFVDAAGSVPFPIWVGILFIAGLIWFAVELALAPVIDDGEMCESCGAVATVELADGSFWCGDCDAGARAHADSVWYAPSERERRQRIRDCARSWGAKR